MTRYYIKLGSEVPFGTSEHRITYDPTDLSTAQALWSALPPPLRLALAKTAPRAAGPWKEWNHRQDMFTRSEIVRGIPSGGGGIVELGSGGWKASIRGTTIAGWFPTLASAQSACDAELLRQGYALESEAEHG